MESKSSTYFMPKNKKTLRHLATLRCPLHVSQKWSENFPSQSPRKDMLKHLYQSSPFTLFLVSHSATNILLSQPVKQKERKKFQILSSFFPSSFNELVISQFFQWNCNYMMKKKKKSFWLLLCSQNSLLRNFVVQVRFYLSFALSPTSESYSTIRCFSLIALAL